MNTTYQMVAVASEGESYSLIAFKSPYFQEEPFVAPVIPPPFPLFYLHENKGKRGEDIPQATKSAFENKVYGNTVPNRIRTTQSCRSMHKTVPYRILWRTPHVSEEGNAVKMIKSF
jgi:hypothetical protein